MISQAQVNRPTEGGSPEGTAVLSTGEVGATKFLREDGDGTSSWQAVGGGSWSSTGNFIYPSTIGDSVGVGTDTPAFDFEVNGNAGVDTITADIVIYDLNEEWMAYGDSYTFTEAYYVDQVEKHINFSSLVNRGANSYTIANIVTRLKSDLSGDPTFLDNADIITVQFGQNDYRLDSTLGIVTDTADHWTMVGQLKYFLETVQTANGGAKVYVITPVVTGDTANDKGWYLRDAAYMMNEVCRLYGISVIDWNTTSGFNAQSASILLSGTHPTATGAVVLGDIVAKAFINNPSNGNTAIGAPWLTSASGIYYIGGNVAIGHDSPAVELSILGTGSTAKMSILASGGKVTSVGSGGSSGFFEYTDAFAIRRGTSGYGNVYFETDEVYIGSDVGAGGGSAQLSVKSNNRVGVNNTSPSVALDVTGEIKGNAITIASDTSATAVVGKIVFQAADSTFYGCRSTVASKKWYSLH